MRPLRPRPRGAAAASSRLGLLRAPASKQAPASAQPVQPPAHSRCGGCAAAAPTRRWSAARRRRRGSPARPRRARRCCCWWPPPPRPRRPLRRRAPGRCSCRRAARAQSRGGARAAAQRRAARGRRRKAQPAAGGRRRAPRSARSSSAWLAAGRAPAASLAPWCRCWCAGRGTAASWRGWPAAAPNWGAVPRYGAPQIAAAGRRRGGRPACDERRRGNQAASMGDRLGGGGKVTLVGMPMRRRGRRGALRSAARAAQRSCGRLLLARPLLSCSPGKGLAPPAAHAPCRVRFPAAPRLQAGSSHLCLVQLGRCFDLVKGGVKNRGIQGRRVHRGRELTAQGVDAVMHAGQSAGGCSTQALAAPALAGGKAVAVVRGCQRMLLQPRFLLWAVAPPLCQHQGLGSHSCAILMQRLLWPRAGGRQRATAQAAARAARFSPPLVPVRPRCPAHWPPKLCCALAD